MEIDPKNLKMTVKKVFPRHAPGYAGHVKIEIVASGIEILTRVSDMIQKNAVHIR